MSPTRPARQQRNQRNVPSVVRLVLMLSLPIKLLPGPRRLVVMSVVLLKPPERQQANQRFRFGRERSPLPRAVLGPQRRDCVQPVLNSKVRRARREQQAELLFRRVPKPQHRKQQRKAFPRSPPGLHPRSSVVQPQDWPLSRWSPCSLSTKRLNRLETFWGRLSLCLPLQVGLWSQRTSLIRPLIESGPAQS